MGTDNLPENRKDEEEQEKLMVIPPWRLSGSQQLAYEVHLAVQK